MLLFQPECGQSYICYCPMSYDAELLVLDEPTAGLDVISRNELLDRIRDYMEPGFRFTNACDVIDKLGIS